VDGKVKSLDARARGRLDGDVEGYLRASEVADRRDINQHLKEGDPVNAMIINVDRKNRTINLSIKQKSMAEETEAIQKHAVEAPASTGTTNLGALLKAKLDNKNSTQ
jgi:small subunit ribosomal protein S1